MIANLNRAYLIGLLSLTGLAALFTIGVILMAGSSWRWEEAVLMSAFGIGHNLHALTHPVCPECGTRLRDEEVPGGLIRWAQAIDAQRP